MLDPMWQNDNVVIAKFAMYCVDLINADHDVGMAMDSIGCHAHGLDTLIMRIRIRMIRMQRVMDF